jgi:hypothetical protein
MAALSYRMNVISVRKISEWSSTVWAWMIARKRESYFLRSRSSSIQECCYPSLSGLLSFSPQPVVFRCFFRGFSFSYDVSDPHFAEQDVSINIVEEEFQPLVFPVPPAYIVGPMLFGPPTLGMPFYIRIGVWPFLN